MNLITNAPQMTNPTLTRRTSLVSARACIAAWLDTLSVLVARGRAQVGVAAATTDWPKRIRDMRYADQDDRGTAD